MVPPLNLNLAAPSTSGSSLNVDGRLGFDGSGWTVATGGARSTGGASGGMAQGGFNAPAQRPASQVGGYFEPVPQWGAGVQQPGGGGLTWLLILGGAALLLLR